MDLQIIDPTEYVGWDELLLSVPAANIFHTASWANVLKESYDYRPLYFTRIKNSKISVLIPIMEINSGLTGKRGVSLPFTDYCEPIIDDQKENPQIFSAISRTMGRRMLGNVWRLGGEENILMVPFPPKFTSTIFLIYLKRRIQSFQVSGAARKGILKRRSERV